jgi:hypothetical protein
MEWYAISPIHIHASDTFYPSIWDPTTQRFAIVIGKSEGQAYNAINDNKAFRDMRRRLSFDVRMKI